MRRIFAAAVPVFVVFGLAAPAPGVALGQRRLIAINDNQSTNWSGYVQGTLEKGNKLFTQVSGDWVVPTATHRGSGAEFSSAWIGIGGGCIDAACSIGDLTLIQTGTESDVAANGTASYSAWWEIIPAPSITISQPVGAGDSMHADIRATVPGLWTIKLTNVSRGWTFTQTVPYPSTMTTAEWVLETPVIIGANAGIASMPNLTTTHFNNAQVNNAVNNFGAPSAQLISSEKLQLVRNGQVVATPSNPDTGSNGFNVCTWASSCSVPAD